MARRSLHVLLVLLVGLLTIGEAYHYHPDGGEHWEFVSLAPSPSPSAAEASGTDGNDSPDGRTTCPLDLWASLLATVIILLALVLLRPAPGNSVARPARHHHRSRARLTLSTRGPPLPA